MGLTERRGSPTRVITFCTNITAIDVYPRDRWLALCLNQEGCTLREHATCEGVDNSYVSRIVNLTTLSPDIVAAIFDDALSNHLTLFDLVVNPPALWEEQRERIGGQIAS